MKEFRIYPENKSLYCVVQIFDTREEMYAADETGHTDYEAKFTAVDHFICKEKKWNKTPRMGFVTFYKSKCGGGIVAHEMFHATLAWARRKKLQMEDLYRDEEIKNSSTTKLAEKEKQTEESMAWVQGNLVAQFYRNYYDTQEDY